MRTRWWSIIELHSKLKCVQAPVGNGRASVEIQRWTAQTGGFDPNGVFRSDDMVNLFLEMTLLRRGEGRLGIRRKSGLCVWAYEWEHCSAKSPGGGKPVRLP